MRTQLCQRGKIDLISIYQVLKVVYEIKYQLNSTYKNYYYNLKYKIFQLIERKQKNHPQFGFQFDKIQMQ